MNTVTGTPSDSDSLKNRSHCEFGSKLLQASGSCNADAARDAPAQADGSCGTFSVHDVMVEPVNADDDPLGQSSVVTNDMKNAMMMSKVFRATKSPVQSEVLAEVTRSS